MSKTSASTLYKQLVKEFDSKNCSLDKCGSLLNRLKIALLDLQFIVAKDDQQPNKENLLLARNVLEIGAFWAVRAKNTSAFERYYAQLQVYHVDYATVLPPSSRYVSLLGLNLLSLLAQNRISEFHTVLETIPALIQAENPFVQYPIELEQRLMEGSYNRVLASRGEVPIPEYLYFLDMLEDTIRGEIAVCAEKAYDTLSLDDAKAILSLDSTAHVSKFASQRGWMVQPSKKMVVFSHGKDVHEEAIPSEDVMKHMLKYARELESIV
jgi:26S proteasome regulatory subunit N12